MRIFLIGFMGSGKTTMGKKVAKALHYNFVDLDDYIVKKVGKDIRNIFEEKGEEFFRDLEKESLIEICKKNNLIIATGGGTPCFLNNMKKILYSGTSIYLKMKIEDLLERIEAEKIHRPLIRNKSTKELKDFIDSTLLEREPFYRQSNLIVNAKNITAKEIIRLIS